MGKKIKLEYSLFREKRRTVTIHISDGKVVVKAPITYPVEKIEDFLTLKQDWINSKLEKQCAQKDKFQGFFDFTHVLFLGKSYEILTTRKVKKCELTKFNFLVPIEKDGSINYNKRIKEWFILAAKKLLLNFLEISAKATGMNFNEFSLTNAKSKWGSCDSDKNIKLNFRLLFFSEEVIKYVIIHELCHTLHPNHSKDFWNCVKKFEPNYLKMKKVLKDASILIGLMR